MPNWVGKALRKPSRPSSLNQSTNRGIIVKYYILYSSTDEFESALFADYDDAVKYLYDRINNCMGDVTITREEVYSTDDSKFVALDWGSWIIIEPVELW